ncbi:MAG: type II secretion system major pseudopilin GspG [Planctomycetota bacterium]
MNTPMETSRARRTAGFSLVELMVVIVILGILGTAVTVAFFPQIFKAQRGVAEDMIRSLDQAVKMYALDNNNRKPNSLEDLVEPTPESETGYLESNSVPLDPWGNPFTYRPPSSPTGDDYDIISFGEDGYEGGDGKGEDITLYNLRNQNQDGGYR